MNKKLLLDVATAIEANPEHFDMGSFCGKNDCGTTACIAGWAVALSIDGGLNNLPLIDEHSISDKARKVLEIDIQTGIALFFANDWRHHRLQRKYFNAQNAKEDAKIAAAYVRWFVENN